jgi:uncharacterized membrane protein YgaE (UPF0421/DUF939 family)
MNRRRSTLTAGLQLSLRAGVAAGLAVAIAQFLDLEYPIYALIAAVIVMDLSPSKTRKLAVQRLMGTLLGATVGAALSHLLPSGPLALVVSIAIAMLLSYLVHLQDGAKLAGYTCGLVVFAFGAHPWSYAVYRVAETLLGIGTAVLVSFVPKLMGTSADGERSFEQ